MKTLVTEKMCSISLSIILLSSIVSLLSLIAVDATLAAESSSSDGAHPDFNGDGFADLAIGIRGEGKLGAFNHVGAVHVLYGSTARLQAVSPDDQFFTQDSGGVDDTAEDVDNFGWVLATGDFNDDGFDDLAVGVPFEDVGSITDAGGVNVLYGSSSGLRSTAALDGTGRTDQFWTQNTAGVEDAAEENDAFGYSLTAGDFNADGKADLAIGVLFEDIGAISDVGAVNVLYGSSSGLQTSSPADQFWHQNSAGVNDSAESKDGFGGSLAAGDFNNDAYDDLAIGAAACCFAGFGEFAEDIGTVDGAGAVNVLYGSASRLQTSSPADQFWHQDSPDVLNNAENFESFGLSLEASDFNNDGYDDLAVGVPYEEIGTVLSGAVNVLYGSGSGLQATSPDDQFWHQGKPDVEDVEETVDLFGNSLASGDLNNDGFDDLAIGVPSEGINPGESSRGAVNVLYGSSSGLQTSSPADQFWTQDSPGVLNTAESNDNYGSSLG